MALYENGKRISGIRDFPAYTWDEYHALPVAQRPKVWKCTDRDYTEIPPHQVSTGDANIIAWKSGCVASIHFVNTVTAGAGVAFATFPDELKPNHIAEFKDTYSGKRIQINTSGAVSCTEALSNAPIRGTFTYVTKS